MFPHTFQTQIRDNFAIFCLSIHMFSASAHCFRSFSGFPLTDNAYGSIWPRIFAMGTTSSAIYTFGTNTALTAAWARERGWQALSKNIAASPGNSIQTSQTFDKCCVKSAAKNDIINMKKLSPSLTYGSPADAAIFLYRFSTQGNKLRITQIINI